MNTKTNQATARMFRAAAIAALCWVICCGVTLAPASSYADELGDVEVTDVIVDEDIMSEDADAVSADSEASSSAAASASDDDGQADANGDGLASSAASDASASSTAASATDADEADDAADDADDADDAKKGSSPSDGADTTAPEVGEGDAWLEELDSIRTKIDKKLAEIDRIASDIEKLEERSSDLSGEIKDLDKKISKLADKIAKKQQEHAELQKHASELTRTVYKNRGDFSMLTLLDEAESLSDMLARMDMRQRVLDEYDSVIAKVKAKQVELEADYEQASEDKDTQVTLEKELEAEQKKLEKKRKKLERAIEDLREREDALDVDQKIKLSEAAEKSKKVIETFKTGELAEFAGAEWHKGYASAYGGSSDDPKTRDVPTATGTICDDWSMGVAVPMVWGPAKYYGKHVEISYEGRSVIATVVDCGDMNGGERALDLQPGVFRAFGATDCDDWGVRAVRYRFL